VAAAFVCSLIQYHPVVHADHVPETSIPIPIALILPATDETIRLATEALAAGKLVGMPTETVYGLAANAWDVAAVGKIFAAKSRPATNPLIVHVASVDRLSDAIAWPPSKMIQRQLDALVDLWPGPLSIVCPRGAKVPDVVTACRPTVAVRIPAHPISLRLLAECPFPLAAPSANRSRYISPTLPRHVCDASGLGDHVAMVIDGGPCHHGVESTIVMLGQRPRLLRPGSITAEQLSVRLGVDLGELCSRGGEAQSVEGRLTGPSIEEPLLAPGMMREHYAPSTPLVLLNRETLDHQPLTCRDVPPLGNDGPDSGVGIGRIAFRRLSPEDSRRYRVVETLSEHGDLGEVARNLFASLRRLDQAGLAVIHCDTCQPDGLGLAIMDRLQRAAARTESKNSSP
jgi:L-threonylcarbamoyladenylate synthase